MLKDIVRILLVSNKARVYVHHLHICAHRLYASINKYIIQMEVCYADILKKSMTKSIVALLLRIPKLFTRTRQEIVEM